jgi:5-methylcytosine-specific restriction endonuclease McrA
MKTSVSCFNIDEYKTFLLNIGDWDSVTYKKSKCPEKEIFVSALTQFDCKPYELLPIARASFSKYVNIIYKEQLVGKPHQASPSKFLLHYFGFRVCAFCKNILPLKDFYKRNGKSSNWDKLRNDCKQCESLETKLPQNKEIIRKKSLKYRINNKDKIKQYRVENSEKINCYTAQRRARIQKATSSEYSQQEEQRYRKIAKYLSMRYKEKYVLDHYVPISKGGKHSAANWQIITEEENLYKNQILPEVFYTSDKGIWFIENKKGIRIST